MVIVIFRVMHRVSHQIIHKWMQDKYLFIIIFIRLTMGFQSKIKAKICLTSSVVSKEFKYSSTSLQSAQVLCRQTCNLQMLWSACTGVQADQSICWLHKMYFWKHYHRAKINPEILLMMPLTNGLEPLDFQNIYISGIFQYLSNWFLWKYVLGLIGLSVLYQFWKTVPDIDLAMYIMKLDFNKHHKVLTWMKTLLQTTTQNWKGTSTFHRDKLTLLLGAKEKKISAACSLCK